jgi:hypothetical protein
MKKSFLTIVLVTLILFPTAGLFAQATDNADVEATVTIQAALQLGTVTNIDFGLVALGGGSIILDPDGGTTTGMTGTPVVGQVEVTGATGVDVQVSWTTGVVMEDGSANQINVTPIVNANETADNAGGSSNLGTPAGTTITLQGGNAFLYFGGSFTAPASNAGTYSTSTGTGVPLTVTVDYI